MQCAGRWLLTFVVVCEVCFVARADGPYAANGIKIGELTHNAAIVWTRLTIHPDATEDGAAPGMPGEIRLVCRTSAEAQPVETAARQVDAATDFTCQFTLPELHASQTYELEAFARATPAGEFRSVAKGKFSTPPRPTEASDVCFTVVTGQRFENRDDPQRGHLAYESMLKLQPNFFVHTGDVVYYDKEAPLATDVAGARAKWNRMYALPLQREFHLNVPAYFLKDDHDILKDDCWPGQRYGELTWENGLDIFREQTPSSSTPYRTVRWGRDLQIWLLEGREFRSPNSMPDGQKKTILGQEQFDWLAETTESSDASFKVIISATPIVGPDRRNKNDNHANAGFSNEGDRLRNMLSNRKNVFVVCGDRHWQYVSADPQTGLREYSCGPTSDAHAGGWSDDQFDARMHRFLRVQGGFLSVCVNRGSDQPRIVFRHHAVDGEVVHTETQMVAEETP